MLGLRSLIGLVLSLIFHGGVAAYLMIQTPTKEKPKLQKITLAMDVFSEVPAPVQVVAPKPIVLPTPVGNPLLAPQNSL